MEYGVVFAPEAQDQLTELYQFIAHYKKSAIIAFAVIGQQITVLGVFYGGKDYETALQLDEPGNA